MRRDIRVIAPLSTFHKIEVAELAMEKGIIGTYSCHLGLDEACGVCTARKEFQFEEAYMGGSGGSGWNHLGNVELLEQRAREALTGGKKNVFISFATEDIDEVNMLRAHAKNENSDIEFNDHSVRVPYDSKRAEYVRQKISERIGRCSTTVVYLSSSTANSRWVKWEVERSLELGKRVIAVHSGKTYSGNRLGWLQKSGIKVMPWSNLAVEL